MVKKLDARDFGKEVFIMVCNFDNCTGQMSSGLDVMA